MDKRMTISVSSDDTDVIVSIAEYGENPIPARHVYVFDNKELPAFTEAVYALLKKIVEEV